jgi:hypothetical protein
MGRTVIVAGPLYVDFTTAETQVSSAAHQVMLCPEDPHKGWQRKLGGSAWKVAAEWKRLKPNDTVILLAKIAAPWSKEAVSPADKGPFVDDARWLRDELVRNQAGGGPLTGVEFAIDEVHKRGTDYTFHLRQAPSRSERDESKGQGQGAAPSQQKPRNTDWPAQTIVGGAAHELKWRDVVAATKKYFPPDRTANIDDGLVILCGIARTGILDEVVTKPVAELRPQLAKLPSGVPLKLVIDFGRADLRNWSLAEDGAERLKRLRDFFNSADLVFVDEPTAEVAALLDPAVMPRESLVVRHTLRGTWWAYRVEKRSKNERGLACSENGPTGWCASLWSRPFQPRAKVMRTNPVRRRPNRRESERKGKKTTNRLWPARGPGDSPAWSKAGAGNSTCPKGPGRVTGKTTVPSAVTVI